MKVAVIGSRDLTDQVWIKARLDAQVPLDAVVLLGGAAGVQDVTASWCTENGIDKVLFKPWHLVDFDARHLPFSPRLFFLRNKQIIDNADYVLFLSNGKEESEVDRSMRYALESKDTESVDVILY